MMPIQILLRFKKLSCVQLGQLKKHKEVLAEKFPEYDYVWRSSEEPARKGYAGTMYLYKKGLTPAVSEPIIGAPEPMDHEGRIITLNLINALSPRFIRQIQAVV